MGFCAALMKPSVCLFAALSALLLFSGCATTGSGVAGVKGWPWKRTMTIQYPDGTTAEVPYKAGAKTAKAQKVVRNFEWNPEKSPTGKVKIVIVIGEQKAYVYRGGVQIGWTRVSTGKDGFETPHGNFKILQKSKDHKSNTYGKFVSLQTGEVVDWNADVKMKVPPGCRYEPAGMPFFLRITWDGVGLHSGIVPPHPASHGCIRVRKEIAPKLFEITSVGDAVSVVDFRQ
jgi:lipoprotein-anchoring transpeptidase ErfK/SrfK